MLPDYDEIGYAWEEIFEILNESRIRKVDRVEVLEAYRTYRGLIKLRRHQSQMDYKPEPAIIQRIAKDFFIDIKIQNTTEELEIERHLNRIEANDIFPAPIETNRKKMKNKIPTVAIMGHVDHGKTTLLDYLRKSTLADEEAGGITQAIGSFTLKLDGFKEVTVLDTPGHSTFNQMRERGSSIVDLIVLVVAADDGIMAQTDHAYSLIKKFNQPFIVAITKTDKTNSKPKQVEKQILEKYSLVNQDEIVKCSPKTGYGMEDFHTILSLKLQDMNIMAPYTGPCEGNVIESRSELTGLGRMVTLLVKRGTLNKKDTILCGENVAKIKNIFGENNKTKKSILPGQFG